MAHRRLRNAVGPDELPATVRDYTGVLAGQTKIHPSPLESGAVPRAPIPTDLDIR